MYDIKPFNTITTPNGTKLHLYKANGQTYYGVSRLAKALGYSQFTTDSTLAATFKNQNFYLSYKQISGGSARVADFDQLVPLLEHFIKLSLNITPNSDSQTLILDNARMEAQRLIEMLSDKHEAQSEPKNRDQTEINLFDEQEPQPNSAEADFDYVMLDEPLKYKKTIQAPNKTGIDIYADEKQEYVTFNKILIATSANPDSGKTNSPYYRRRFHDKGITFYRAYTNKRNNSKDGKIWLITIEDAIKIFPQLDWLREENAPTAAHNFGEEEQLVQRLIELQKAKYEQQLDALTKNIGTYTFALEESGREIEKLEAHQEELEKYIAYLKSEKEKLSQSFENKQALLKGMLT